MTLAKKERARRLATLARYINENLDGYEARIEGGFCDTDTKIGRLRIPGKGRTGNRIKVRRLSDGLLVLDHNSAETYRTNSEVEDWIRRVEGGWTPDHLNPRYCRW